jgi:hypothetical protein
MIRILLDGFEPVNRPLGIESLKERFYYSRDYFGYLREFSGTITFYGDDFENFFTLFKQGLCNSVAVEIQESEGDLTNFIEVFRGLIYIKDIDFDLVKRTCDVQIVDDTFVAKILNFAETPISLFSLRTKNGQTITVTPTPILITDHSVITYSNIRAYTQLDILNYIVGWITDNTVTVDSTFLNSAPANDYYFITGPDMRQSSETIPLEVTFQKVIKDLCKIWNLRWVIINNKLTIEPVSFFETADVITIDGFKEFIVSNNEEFDYASFTFGSYNQINTENDITDVGYIPALTLPFGGHSESTISPNGNCAFKSNISLKTELICYDSNSINQCLNNTSDTFYDETLFICTASTSVFYNNVLNQVINNKDLFCVYQLERWLETYCFPYSESVAGCDSEHKSDDLVPITNELSFADEIKEGCYFDGIYFIPLGVVNIELDLEFFCDPNDHMPGVTGGTARMGIDDLVAFLNPYIAPDTVNGWVSGAAIPGTGGTLVEWVDYTYTVGETWNYKCFMTNIELSEPQDVIRWGILPGSDAPFVRLTTNSTIKIYSNAKQVFTGSPCLFNRFKVSSKGSLLFSKANEVRNSRFGQILMPMNYTNITGNILELTRNIENSECQIELNLKTI